jgi:hypothetical protein
MFSNSTKHGPSSEIMFKCHVKRMDKLIHFIHCREQVSVPCCLVNVQINAHSYKLQDLGGRKINSKFTISPCLKTYNASYHNVQKNGAHHTVVKTLNLC